MSSPFATSVLTPRKADGTFAKTRTTLWTEETWDDGFVNKGRFKVYRPDYPRANGSGWAFRAHIVWWLRTGEVPTLQEVIHHKDEVKLNDYFENLARLTHHEHHQIHRKPLVQRVCGYCGREFEIVQWRINSGRGRWCSHRCGILGGRWKR